MKHLYVAECSPNGTNDLIVTDEDHQIVAVIDEAMFGYRVTIDYRIEDQTAAFEDFIGQASREDLEQGYCMLVEKVSIETVLKRICVSPVDPDGERVINQLKAHGLVEGE